VAEVVSYSPCQSLISIAMRNIIDSPCAWHSNSRRKTANTTK